MFCFVLGTVFAISRLDEFNVRCIMLNTAPETRGALPLFGFINRPETPQLAISEPGQESKGDFSMQLGALMMSEYKKGNLDLVALSDLKKVDPQSLQAFAESLSFDVDLESDETMFEQLSGWLAQQGLATSFANPLQNAELTEVSDSELDALTHNLESSFDGVPGLVEDSEMQDELSSQVMAEFNELADELKASVQAMLESIKSADTIEQKNLAVAEFKDSLEKMTSFLKEEQSSLMFDLDIEQSRNLLADFEKDKSTADLPLLADFIQKHLLPRAQKLIDSLPEGQAKLAALDSNGLDSSELERGDLSALETLQELGELFSSENFELEDLSEEDFARVEEIVGFVQTLQLPSQATDQTIHAKPVGQTEVAEELVNTDMDVRVAEDGNEVDQILSQASVFTPASAQTTQQAAPQGLAGMAQASQNRQSQPNANALAGKVQAQSPVTETSSKPLQDIQSPVQTVQQQLNQSNLQQQAMNLNLRDQVAQQQQETLKASDVKYKAADTEGEFELLGIQSTGTERKSGAPALASISYPLRHPQWSQSVGKRIVFMANQQMQQAQISLNPDKLGPIQLRLQLDRDQMVTVSMTAQHGATREALEAAIPRLKEMLEEAGIRFDDVKVEDEETFEQAGQGQADESGRMKSAGASSAEDEDGIQALSSKKQTDNMIDFYA